MIALRKGGTACAFAWAGAITDPRDAEFPAALKKHRFRTIENACSEEISIGWVTPADPSGETFDLGDMDGGPATWLRVRVDKKLLPKAVVVKARDGVVGLKDFRGELVRCFTDRGWIFHSEVCIWKDPVTQMQRTKALGLLHKQLKKDACMSRQGLADYLVTMRKPGDNAEPCSNTNETFPVSEWQQYASPVWMDINPSDTLQGASAREEQDERHICPLQLEVIRRAVRLWSRPDDLVLSPFAGIGSEGFEAVKAGRRFVGVELKRSYFEQACANLRVAVQQSKQRTLFGAAREASA